MKEKSIWKFDDLKAGMRVGVAKKKKKKKLTEKQLLQAERNAREYNKKEAKILNKVFLTKQDRDRILADLSRSKKDA